MVKTLIIHARANNLKWIKDRSWNAAQETYIRGVKQLHFLEILPDSLLDLNMMCVIKLSIISEKQTITENNCHEIFCCKIQWNARNVTALRRVWVCWLSQQRHWYLSVVSASIKKLVESFLGLIFFHLLGGLGWTGASCRPVLAKHH